MRELVALFRAFEREERARAGSAPESEGVRRQVVAPNALREALHALDSGSFSLGELCELCGFLSGLGLRVCIRVFKDGASALAPAGALCSAQWQDARHQLEAPVASCA